MQFPYLLPMLNRSISRWEMVLLIINGVIGAGIFGLPAKAYKDAGIYSLLALVVCAAAVFVIVFCFAEVASRFSKTGGPYAYAQAAFGPWAAFLTGWLLLLTRFITYAALINLMVTYMSVFSTWFNQPLARNLTIIVITLLLTWFNYIGVRNSTRVNNVLTLTKLSALLVFVVVGSLYVKTENFQAGPFPGFHGFSSTVLLLVFAFGGFESVLVNTGEVRDPERNLPFALLNATLLIATAYLLILLVCIGTLPTLGNSEKPLAEAAGLMMGKGGAVFIAIGAVCSIMGTLNAIMLAGSRLPFAFSEEKQFPSLFSYVHPKYHTPTWSLVFYSLVTIVISLSYSFIAAASISAITRVMIYAIVCGTLLILRRKSPGKLGYYHVRYGKLLALGGIGISLWLISSSQWTELRDIAIAVAAGALLLLLYYRFRRS
jgi:amino acid transporter